MAINRKRREWRTNWKITRRQQPVKGGRFGASAGLPYEEAKWVEAECRRYGVGKSFVLKSAVSVLAKIKYGELYFRPTDNNGKR